ncbi:hypothetical protein V6Z12_A13G126400 [Gossypium hirsutum]
MENQHDKTRVSSVAISKAIEDVAATRIQAAFRSYLARKALHALKGLVKLQALVRGQLVRKQATSTLGSMHALMAIQVRARIHRIQMAAEPRLNPKSLLLRYGRFPLEKEFKRAQKFQGPKSGHKVNPNNDLHPTSKLKAKEGLQLKK